MRLQQFGTGFGDVLPQAVIRWSVASWGIVSPDPVGCLRHSSADSGVPLCLTKGMKATRIVTVVVLITSAWALHVL